MTNQQMTICLWFDNEAVQAANFYKSIFKNSSIGNISWYGKEGFEFHHKPVGSVMTVEFTLNGIQFIGLNGRPQFKFNEAISIVVNCETQEEIDHYWTSLAKGGEEGPCGWLKDKFGVSWQVVPAVLSKLMRDPQRSARVTQAFLKMKKFDIEKLMQA